MIRGVIFDLDNTLVDFMKMKELCIKAAVNAMKDAGLDMPDDEATKKLFAIYDSKGIEYQMIFDDFLKEEYGKVDYKLQAAGIHAYRRQRIAALVTYPNVSSTLIKLIKKGIKLGVVSDAPRPQAWLRLVQLDLHHFFDSVVTFDDTGVRKPDSKPFIKCLDELGLKPEESLMVGDWPERDMVGAGAVGMKTVFARYGDVFETVKSNADYEINDFTEILGVVDKNI